MFCRSLFGDPQGQMGALLGFVCGAYPGKEKEGKEKGWEMCCEHCLQTHPRAPPEPRGAAVQVPSWSHPTATSVPAAAAAV